MRKRERTKKQKSKSAKREKRSGAHNFVQNLKWGPFWQQAAAKPQNGATGIGGRRCMEEGEGGRW